MRLTLDTCILASAFRSRRGPSYALLSLLYERKFQMPTSYALFLEYESVLKRPAQRAAHGISVAGIDAFLNDLADRIDQVRVSYRYRPTLRDADDELVLEAAVNGNAEAIVTYNVTDFAPAASHFGLRVITPSIIINQGRLRS